MLIHISRDRLNHIKSQGWRFGNLPAVLMEEFLSNPDQHIVEYHIINTDHGFCRECRTMKDSAVVSTPAELEMLKASMVN